MIDVTNTQRNTPYINTKYHNKRNFIIITENDIKQQQIT